MSEKKFLIAHFVGWWQAIITWIETFVKRDKENTMNENKKMTGCEGSHAWAAEIEINTEGLAERIIAEELALAEQRICQRVAEAVAERIRIHGVVRR